MLTLTDPCFTAKDRIYTIYRNKGQSFVELMMVIMITIMLSVFILYAFEILMLLNYFHMTSTDIMLVQKYFCNHNIINIARDFPLVQPFSCSPLKGRENALATSCSMRQILDMHFVVLHCPLLVSFGQVS